MSQRINQMGIQAMQLIIVDPWFAKQQTWHVSGPKLVIGFTASLLTMVVLIAVSYNLLVLHGVRQGWSISQPLAELVAGSDRLGQERFMRENLDALAARLGEMQAKVLQLDELASRVASLAGVPLGIGSGKAGAGGVLTESRSLTLREFQASLDATTHRASVSTEQFEAMESQLFALRVRKAMLPTEVPVRDGRLGSGFGYRIDPLNGQRALHTGLDFAAEPGSAILAAAGGVVVTREFHPAYGNMVEIDHGNDLITRYAHASKVHVQVGEVVKAGKHIADVGSTGRSTGPHLHFEVWVGGTPQDPQRFLDAAFSESHAANSSLGSLRR